MFNEDSRVKIPAIVHLTRLGYQYIPRKEIKEQADPDTNILRRVFSEQIKKLNPQLSDDSLPSRLIQDIRLELDYDDLGREFFKRLKGINSEIKLIDFDNFKNNVFHVTTELTCKNGEDEFRPDIAIFINGIPLGFVEVKKPNNREGIKAERDRMNKRLANRKFRRFFNEFQIYMFSNNMEYEDGDVNHLMGAYYATGSKEKLRYNHFYEQMKTETVEEIKEIDEAIEDFILKDNNHVVIKNSPEYKTNKNPETPTNRIITSLLSKPRLEFILKYGLVYVNKVDEKTGDVEIQKHIMRYPQLFASKAIMRKLDDGEKRGVIWHTQGSGKTALAYFSVGVLTNYYKKKKIVPKFYFIVDRIDLAIQASTEFTNRGLTVRTVNSREELNKEFANNTAKTYGDNEICVVNIQKFKDDTTVLNDSGYDIKVQRVFFLDEAHRSYNPKGSFLANLYGSDKESIKIALTGTPLIVRESEGGKKLNQHTTRDIFGDYIHKYYYNESIRDGYTLKLLREEIETTYREKMNSVYKTVQVQLGDVDKRLIYAHPKYVAGMLDFIIDDFTKSRIQYGDETIGAMVVCSSAIEAEGKPNQARELFNQFNEKYGDKLKAALITNEEGDKKTRKDQIRDFKDGKIDILFVYNMLLTGFDCPRLKKLYLARVVKAHNLLQTLTRVNRPYRNFRMGYVVDFANIQHEFDVTNQAYLEELKGEYSEGLDEDPNNIFGSIFMSRKEIEDEIRRVKEAVFDYTLDNLEIFSGQVSQIQDRETLNNLRRALESSRELSNLIRLFGHEDLLKELDFKQLGRALNIVGDRIALLNMQKALTDSADMSELVNTAIEDVMFNFEKIHEEELKLAAEDCQILVGKTRKAFGENWDTKDPQYLTLYEAFLEIMRRQNIAQQEFNYDSKKQAEFNRQFEDILEKIKELNRKNNMLADKYHGNQKAARVDKRLSVYADGSIDDPAIRYGILNDATRNLDEQILKNSGILNSEGYFKGQVEQSILTSFDKVHTSISYPALKYATDQIFDEYIKEFKGEE